MSAIAGVARFDGAPVDAGTVERMTASMTHRGPDGIGQWRSAAVALGHCAFHSVPEALVERQPLANSDGSIVLVLDGRVVGIVTDRDLRDVFPSSLESARRKSRHHTVVDPDRVCVGDVMSQPVYSLSADDSLREAAGLLRRLRIGAVPILDEKSRMYGILTRSDLLRALAENVDPHDL